MKNLYIFLVFLFAISLKTYTQEINKTSIDSKNQTSILIGLCNRDGLKAGDFGNYYFMEYSTYKPDSAVISKLKNLNKNLTFIIVSGTWCGDTKEQLPRFYKIIDESGFDENDISLICIDREKKAGDLNIDSLKISHIPTFIIYSDNKEAGRIIETPKETLEKDLYQIIPKVN